MAAILFNGDIPASDVARMTSHDWAAFAAGLRAKGVLKPNSTVPSAETIARTLFEVAALERARVAALPAIPPRGYASIAPGIVVRVRRRRAA